jgi:transcription-repair coupling factor (superfamily II helicase)
MYILSWFISSSYEIEDNANVLLRAEVLNRINSRKKPAIIVTIPKRFSRKW